MSDTTAKPRPEFRNISIGQAASYHLPLAGKVSILHRISGFGLFLCLPLVLLPLFQSSVISEIGFERFHAVVSYPLVKLLLLVIIWGYLHHFCAGIRFLLLDLHVGLEKEKAQRTAGTVLVVSLALTVVFGLKLFGVF